MTGPGTVFGRVCRLMFRGWGSCYKCWRTWNVIAGRQHVTHYNAGGGVFPLCEDCWQELGTPEARWPYYAELLLSWATQGSRAEPEKAEAIWQAVRDGK